MVTVLPQTPVDPADFSIAFGSCNKHNAEQKLWDDVLAQRPDAWVWLGDNIYGDSENMDVIKRKYDAQLAKTWYAKLVNEIAVYGTWDDHDYGKNDAGKEYKKKKETRDLMFEFLNVPKSNEAWGREGAYQSYIIEKSDITLKLILLDCRYFRDEDNKSQSADILGEAQWEWLSKELQKNEADIHLIGNGIQILAEEHKYEKWANFPTSRKRLLDLIESSAPNYPIFLSGDRHISELSAVNVDGYDYPIYDITSSGLTHPWTSFPGEANRHRIGEVIHETNFGLLRFSKLEDSSLSVLYQVRGNHNIVLAEYELFP